MDPLCLNLAEHFEDHGADGGGGGLRNSRSERRDDKDCSDVLESSIQGPIGGNNGRKMIGQIIMT